jgi:hypothetical protein
MSAKAMVRCYGQATEMPYGKPKSQAPSQSYEAKRKYYIPTKKPPPITLPKLKFLEEKDDG